MAAWLYYESGWKQITYSFDENNFIHGWLRLYCIKCKNCHTGADQRFIWPSILSLSVAESRYLGKTVFICDTFP